MQESNEPTSPAKDAPSADVRRFVELGSATLLVLAPFLYWINGPAVSADQFVVRTALVASAAATLAFCRIYRWQRRRR